MTTDISQPGFFRRHRNLLTGLLLALAAWVMYLPSTQYGYVYYDDIRILRDHPELYGQPSFAADLKAIFVTSYPREEPLLLRDVTWAVDGQIFGFDNTFGYHLNNVVLHGLVVATLFAVLLGMTGRYGFALATTAAYLLLAVHVETAAWIMGRKYSFSTLFMLLALGAQTRRLKTSGLAAACAWQALVLLFFVIALLSKISVLTFPLVLFLHAMLQPYLSGEQPPAAPLAWNRKLFRELAIFVPGLLVSGLIYRWYQHTLAQMGIFDRGYQAHGLAHLWNLLMVNPLGFWLYLKQIFLPSHLAVLYAWPYLQPTYPAWQIAVAIATVTAALAGGIWIFCRRKDLFFYYAAFFVLMVPYLNLIYIGIWVADRYVYFSSFCVLAIAVSLAGEIWRRSQRAGQLVVLTLAAGFTADNVTQIIRYEPAWQNAETLWQNHIAQPGHTPTVYANLAAYYYADFTAAITRQDQPRMAVTLHKMSVVIEAGLTEYWPDQRQPPPDSVYFLFFLRSIVQEVKGEPEAALDSLLTAFRLNPKFDSTSLNLALLYDKLAGTATDPKQRETYACAARDRYKQYIALAYRGRAAPADVQKKLVEFEAACPGANQPAEKNRP